MRRLRGFSTLLASFLALAALGTCSVERSSGSGDAGSASGSAMVGISMPTRSLERWNNDGSYLARALNAQGLQTSLQYADSRVDQQISQIQDMINDGASVLVIAAVDGAALDPVLQLAADEGIQVLAYDRLITGTEHVQYYATFDNELIGKLQGDYIVEKLGLDRGETGPFTIEMFAGSADDTNARHYFCGAFAELEPYFQSGALVSLSGKVPSSCDGWTQLAIQGWTSAKAQAEMDNRLNSFYGGEKRVDVVLSPNDSLALGITQALLGAGYTPDDFPILTGQDADVANVQSIIDGTQAMTVWTDTRTLGDQVSTMVGHMVSGESVPVNDTETYHNGVKYVPTYLLPPQLVERDQIQPLLVESGFIDAAELNW